MKKLKPRCYVCGELINPVDGFLVFSLTQEIDRVFVCCQHCKMRLESPFLLCIEPRPTNKRKVK